MAQQLHSVHPKTWHNFCDQPRGKPTYICGVFVGRQGSLFWASNYLRLHQKIPAMPDGWLNTSITDTESEAG